MSIHPAMRPVRRMVQCEGIVSLAMPCFSSKTLGGLKFNSINVNSIRGKKLDSLVFLESIKSRKKNPQKLTQLSSRSHPRHLVGKRTAQTDTIIDTTSDSQVNSNFPYRWSPASLTFNNYFYLFLCPRRNFGWHIKIAPSVRP